MYGSICYIKFWKRKRNSDRKEISRCEGLESGALKEISGVIEMLCIMITVVVASVKTHCIVHLKLVNCIVCNIHLNKADQKTQNK